MYEPYSRQALPSKDYRELLGTALAVFASNNSFIIENILNNDSLGKYNWHQLIDRTSGQLANAIKETITNNSNDEISDIFKIIVEMRNRIIHGFQITSTNGEQILATKDKNNKQFEITSKYLMDFIKYNEQLCTLLYDFRDSTKKK